MKFTFSILVVLTCVAALTPGRAQPVLKFDQEGIRVNGLTGNASAATSISQDEWHSIFPIYTHDAYIRKIDQPVGGKYTWDDDGILFVPAYPFAPGQTYHALFSPEAFSDKIESRNEPAHKKLELSFSIPIEKSATTSIEFVYPQSATLPENLLRMYIYFSAPMMPGEAYDHIKLLREDGTPVEKAFLVVDQELWDAERKRFTLLFDPGRIKRDLKSNLDLGTPLREGETYHLVIDSTWRDIHGNALGKSIVKTFSVTRAVRSKMSPQNWKVSAPVAGALGDVIITFDRPVDYALALKYLSISCTSGYVKGRAEMVDDTHWKFTPDQPWKDGEYSISATPFLEDVAGNNLNNAFDLDLSKERRVNSMEPIRLRLAIENPAR